jgi:hypothetical protein
MNEFIMHNSMNEKNTWHELQTGMSLFGLLGALR